MTTDDEYPEHAKQKLVLGKAQTIGDFLDETPYVLAEWVEDGSFRDPRLVPVGASLQTVLADYLGIDLNKIEEEKRRMLRRMQEMNTD